LGLDVLLIGPSAANAQVFEKEFGMKGPRPLEINIAIHGKFLPIFSQLLGQGFTTGIRTGCSVKELLRDQLGFEEAYIENRIQTLFLNYRAVDDMDTAIVNHGAILALSAAMPGLAGATFRKSGSYSVMRRQISHENGTTSSRSNDGEITLRLFNLIAKEEGPRFLKNGILIKGRDLDDLLCIQPKRFFRNLKGFMVNGKEADPEKSIGDKNVILKVETDL
jgi:hypothetical protein